MGSVDGKVTFLIDYDTKQADKELNSLEKSNKNTAASIAAGSAMIAAGSATIVMGFNNALDAALDFEQGMAQVSTMYGNVAVNQEHLNNTMQDLQIQTGLTSQELSSGLYSALSAGIPVTEDMAVATDFLYQMSKLASGGFTSLETAVDATTSILNAYGMGADQTQRIMDGLIMTQNLGKTTVDELAGSLSAVIPTAAAMNVSFEQVAAALATMTAQGTPTAQATTQLNSLLVELGKTGTITSDRFNELSGQTFQEFMTSGGDLGEAMKILTTDLGDAGIATEIFADETLNADQKMEKLLSTTGMSEDAMIDMFGSIEAAKAAMQIAAGDGQKFASSLDGITNSAGATDAAAEKMVTTNKKLSQAQAAITVGFQEMGAMILEFLNPALDYFIANSDTLVPILFGVTAALAILAVVVGIFLITSVIATAVTTAFGVAVAILTSPITLVILAVIAFVAVLWYLWNNFDQIMKWIGDAWNWLVGMFKKGIDAIVNAFKWMGNIIYDIFKGIVNSIIWILNLIPTGLENLINGVIDGIGWLTTQINKIPGINIPVVAGNISIPKIPSLAIGTNYVNSDGLAEIHKGEAIVPADVVAGGFKQPYMNNNRGNTTINVEIKDTVAPDDFANRIIQSIDGVLGEKLGVNNYGN